MAGRPTIGPPINIRLPEDWIAAIDLLAADHDVSRAEQIRRMILDSLRLHNLVNLETDEVWASIAEDTSA